jgi:hypothetical protein
LDARSALQKNQVLNAVPTLDMIMQDPAPPYDPHPDDAFQLKLDVRAHQVAGLAPLSPRAARVRAAQEKKEKEVMEERDKRLYVHVTETQRQCFMDLFRQFADTRPPLWYRLFCFVFVSLFFFFF